MVSVVVFVFAWLISSAAAATPFVAALGSCNHNSCRLLYESSFPLKLNVSGRDLVTLPPTTHGPTVYIVKDLLPGAHLGTLEGVPVRFVTTLTRHPKIAFVSCNRMIEDRGETDHYDKLAQTERHLTVHLGDQVYLDRVDKRGTYEEILERVRNVYRISWQPITRALLSSPNVMLPDDHDVTNNLSKLHASNSSLQLFVRACVQAYYEYQHALVEDIPDNVSVEQMPLYRFITMGNTGLALLDTRFERVFRHPVDGLLGDRQFQQFQEALSKWHSMEHVIVATTFPLVYINPWLSEIVWRSDGEQYPLLARVPSFQKDVLRILDMVASEVGHLDVLFIGGDHHHYALQNLTKNADMTFRSIVTSGMTSGSTTARTAHSAALFVGTSIAPASLGPWKASIADEVFLGKNFAVVDCATPIAQVHAYLEDMEKLQGAVWFRQQATLLRYRSVQIAFITALLFPIALLILRSRVG